MNINYKITKLEEMQKNISYRGIFKLLDSSEWTMSNRILTIGGDFPQGKVKRSNPLLVNFTSESSWFFSAQVSDSARNSQKNN